VDTLVFDKTGTLTKGRPEVTDFKVFEGDEIELTGLIGKLETASEHHLGRAVVEYAEKTADLSAYTMQQASGVKGRGIEGDINNHSIIAGNRKMLLENGIDISDNIESYAIEGYMKGNTAVLEEIYSNLEDEISISDKLSINTELVLNIQY